MDPFSLTDKMAYWFGLDDLIAAGVGAVGGMAGQLVSDVIDGATTWKWEFKWQDYAGSAIGGAAGGVTTLYAGPIAGGAVAGGVTWLSKEGLTYISNPNGYTKSGWDVVNCMHSSYTVTKPWRGCRICQNAVAPSFKQYTYHPRFNPPALSGKCERARHRWYYRYILNPPARSRTITSTSGL